MARTRSGSNAPNRQRDGRARSGYAKRVMTKHSKRAIEKLSAAAFLLNDEDAQSAKAVAYVHSVLCQIGMPRTSTSDRVWRRRNGNAFLRIDAGSVWVGGDREIEQPLPYGPYARLVLADISTYAVRHRTTLIPMESSVSAYMRNRLRLFPGGGKRGTYTSFKRQAQALTAARMALGCEHGSTITNLHAAPIEAFRAWTVDEGPQQALWPCELELSHRYLESLKAHAAPIDMRAYRGLAHTALGQDIYTWLAHRLPRLRKPLGLPWSLLAEQFGGYASVKKFRDEFVKRLKEVQAVYPDARLEVIRGRRGESGGSLRLEQSPPPVRRAAVVLPGSLGARVEMDSRES